MTATGVRAEATARRAARSTTFRRLVKAGLIAFGITHLLIAWLAVQIAWGHPSVQGNQAGAFETLASQPGGRFLVILVGAALAALALWQAFEAALGGAGYTGGRRVAERVVSAGRALVYAALAWTSIRTGMSGQQAAAARQQHVTASVMAHPGGTFLVGLVGVVILGIGVGLVWYGWKEKFTRNLVACPRWVRTLARFGYPAKGVAFGVVGALMIAGAATYDPAKSGGLDAALHTLAAQPFGRLLLTVIALGIAAYGVYCFGQSRYRRI